MKTAIKIGPADHGQRMSLEEFDLAEVQEGYLYELGRGVITVSDVPKPRHMVQVGRIRNQLVVYMEANPLRIFEFAAGSDCKLLIAAFESERHPDLAVYLVPPPETEEEIWSVWIPALVIEVVSPGSEIRDYQEKQEEYLAFGVQEYWIVDAGKEEVLIHRRVGGCWREQVLRPGDKYKPSILPGFEFDCAPVFQAARAAGS